MRKICISWTITGDSFQIECADQNFASWFVECCQTNGNEFVKDDFVWSRIDHFVDDQVLALHQSVEKINLFFVRLKIPIIEIPSDLLHQKSLNLLHKKWVSVHRKHPKIDEMMYKIDPDIFHSFHAVNTLIHSIESSFTYRLHAKNLWRVENPFEPTVEWRDHNVAIGYTDFGKHSYEKWLSRDDDPKDEELSNWMTIGGAVKLNLYKSGGNIIDHNYRSYCEQHDLIPTPQTWPLGNIVDIDINLGKIREMCNRNLQIANNSMRFDLVSH